MWYLKEFQVGSITTTACNCPTGGCHENCRGGKVVEIWSPMAFWIWLKDWTLTKPWTPVYSHIEDVPWHPP